MTRLFPSEFRGRALGIMAALGTLGMVVGSLGGGVLVDSFGWRAIFLGRAPLCLAAIAFSTAFMRIPGDAPHGSGFDLRGAATLFVAVGALILLLSLGGRSGWTEFYIPVLGVVCVGSLAAFVLFERRGVRPILELSIVRHRILAPALATSLLAFVATFVNWFILPFFVIESLGSSASAWGVLLMLMTIATALSSPLGGWLSDRANPSYTMTAALGVSTLAMLSLSRLDSGSSFGAVAVGLAAVGVGMGLFQSSNANLIMGSVRIDRLGMGGGIMGLSRGLGTVFSVAIMGAVFSARERAAGATASEGRGVHPRVSGHVPSRGGSRGGCDCGVVRHVASGCLDREVEGVTESRGYPQPYATCGGAVGGWQAWWLRCEQRGVLSLIVGHRSQPTARRTSNAAAPSPRWR